jgi:DNA-binding transcriptional regulator YhcF (GntR family)
VLDRQAEVPIGVQLAWALRTRIRDGRFKPGQRLPGLRDLAEALGINANTVRAVYQRLEHEGILDSQQGSGTFVTLTSNGPSAVGVIAANAAREAQETGVDPRDVAAALYVAPESPPHPADEEARRRRQLRTQITVLEQALAELQTKLPSLASPASEVPPGTGPQAPPSIGPRLLDAEELEQVQTRLVRRLAAIQAAIDELGDEQGDEQTDPGKSKAASAATAAKRVTKARPKARPAPAGA